MFCKQSQYALILVRQKSYAFVISTKLVYSKVYKYLCTQVPTIDILINIMIMIIKINKSYSVIFFNYNFKLEVKANSSADVIFSRVLNLSRRHII